MGIRNDFFAKSAHTKTDRDMSYTRIISTRTLLEDPYNISQILYAMVDVIRVNPDVRLTLAGDGPDREKYKALARELGLNNVVNFSGWADPAQLAAMLRGHDIYVSTSRFDGASVSLFEAMASGIYPVISDIEANRECLEVGLRGTLFPMDDPGSLADVLLSCMRNTEIMTRAVEMNRRYAREHFSWPGIAKRFESIYMKLGQ